MKPLQGNDSTAGGQPHLSKFNSEDGAHVAEQIGATLLELSLQAREAGLTTLAFLLEAAALEAGSVSQSGYAPPPAP